MRVTTEQGLTLGFMRKTEQLAEVSYSSHSSGELKVGDKLQIEGLTWVVTNIKPSQFVKRVKVATLCLA